MEKLSLKKKGIGSEAKAERLENGDADLQLYNASERARQLHKLKKRRMQGNEDAVSCLQELLVIDSLPSFAHWPNPCAWLYYRKVICKSVQEIVSEDSLVLLCFNCFPSCSQVLAKLEKFKQSISAKPFGSSSSEPGGDTEEDVSDWKKVKLKFAPEHGKVNL